MRPGLLLALTVVLAACASPGAVSVPDNHPASISAETSPPTIAVASLEPVRAPDLPAPLRPDGHPPAGSEAGMDPDGAHGEGAMDHDLTTNNPAATMEADEAAMSHTARHHMPGRWGDDDDDAPEATPAPAADDLAAVLDAYLAVQSALAADDLGAAGAPARALAQALVTLDAAQAEAMQAHAQTLAGAGDLGTARVAFGKLSAPFVAYVEAAGVPEGYDVARFTCGMFHEAPEGGVWLQRGDEVRNPYYGSAMLTCGARDYAMPGVDHREMDHREMRDHKEMMEHEMDPEADQPTDHREMNHDRP